MELSGTPPLDGRGARARRAHAVNLAANLALAGGKVAVGAAAGSPALLAHGLENLADLVSNGLAWLGYRAAAKPPDDDHHYGHHNAEALATVAIGILILGAGLAVIWRVIGGLSATERGLAGLAAIATALASIVVCEGLSRYTARVADTLADTSLRALARDKRSDAMTSGLVLVGVAGSFWGVPWIEPPVAALMGAAIAFLGLRTIREGIDVLMQRVDDPLLRGRLEAVARAVPGVRGVQRVRVLPLGSRYRVDLEIDVDGDLSVREGHQIAEAVEDGVLSVAERVVEVHVHVNPA